MMKERKEKKRKESSTKIMNKDKKKIMGKKSKKKQDKNREQGNEKRYKEAQGDLVLYEALEGEGVTRKSWNYSSRLGLRHTAVY